MKDFTIFVLWYQPILWSSEDFLRKQWRMDDYIGYDSPLDDPLEIMVKYRMGSQWTLLKTHSIASWCANSQRCIFSACSSWLRYQSLSFLGQHNVWLQAQSLHIHIVLARKQYITTILAISGTFWAALHRYNHGHSVLLPMAWLPCITTRQLSCSNTQIRIPSSQVSAST